MTGGLVRVGNRRVQRFVTPPQEVRDGMVRCIACGQIDEAPYHDNALCPATRPHGLAEGVDHEAVCSHAESSDDPVVAMLRDADERLGRAAPDVLGARVGIHAARLAVSSRILAAAPIAPASRAVLLTSDVDVSADRFEVEIADWPPLATRPVLAGDIERERANLEFAQDAYLERWGWTRTCNTPGAFWLWQRDFSADDQERQRLRPYGLITADRDLAVSMTLRSLDERPEEGDGNDD